LKHVAGQHLALAEHRIHRTVQIQSVHRFAGNTLVLHQSQQRFLGPDVQQVIQLLRKMSGRGILDKSLGSIQQSAMAGEPDGLERPQAVLIEVRGFIQRVVTATMGIAGPIGELLQFAEHGDVHFRSQRPLQLRHGSDLAPPERLGQVIGVEGFRSHNVRSPPDSLISR
jgi:hypothetical protein